jgi:hypothetical protein
MTGRTLPGKEIAMRRLIHPTSPPRAMGNFPHDNAVPMLQGW